MIRVEVDGAGATGVADQLERAGERALQRRDQRVLAKSVGAGRARDAQVVLQRVGIVEARAPIGRVAAREQRARRDRAILDA